MKHSKIVHLGSSASITKRWTASTVGHLKEREQAWGTTGQAADPGFSGATLGARMSLVYFSRRGCKMTLAPSLLVCFSIISGFATTPSLEPSSWKKSQDPSGRRIP